MSFIASKTQILAGQAEVDRLNLSTFRLWTLTFGTVCALLAAVLSVLP